MKLWAMKRLNGLDALRGIAAVSVLLHHIGIVSLGMTSNNAYLAVDFFFMLSGYVMARTYEGRLAAGLGAGKFLFLRYVRLWPVMAFAFLLGIPDALTGMGLTETAAFAFVVNMALLPYWAAWAPYPYNVAAWSIFYELVANLMHAVLFWRVRTGLLLFCVFAMGAIFICRGLTAPILRIDGMGAFGFAGGLPRVLMSYPLGIVLYRIWKDTPPIGIPAPVAFLTMPAVFIGTELSGYHNIFIDLVFILILCPAMMAAALKWEPPVVATKLGGISFPLYAVHVPVMTLMSISGLSVFLAIPASFILSVLVDRAVNRLRRSRGPMAQSEVMASMTPLPIEGHETAGAGPHNAHSA
ncbi:acyltransferase family protein [Novosphingobium mathurense]|uniref:Peptidoglycan/LPS O-acetylase OafA/YrhL, contains acyltransferase and SGNH-hydrolase domains n=1 Tax=Novosphingobium mathurense TaxID=428990 RepID=A0A1U6IR97_9SPHN|nr:acyltransferase [Novosphingobium mathurense]SLK10545.1 Peptidoglycan/LPS O-acetylase OafA/YrhL, contains acyltransferase and SGNH-hydrolase domains [Novosphingobium mathurense]